MKIKIIMLIVLGLFINACEEAPFGQQPTESVAPGVVTNVNVINTSGGAMLTYVLPKDDDILYVKAVYSRKEGEIAEAKASIYSDTLKIEGFGDTNPHEIKIVTVDRSRNESSAVNVTINPLEPSVNIIANSLDLSADFGGITSTWVNATKAEISIVLKQKDSINQIVPFGTSYTKAAKGKFSIFGLKASEKTVYAYVQDRWGNRSEIKNYVLTPLFEAKLDKGKFAAEKLPGDGPHHEDAHGGAWRIENIWNGTNGGEGYSSQGGQGSLPQSVSMDLGVVSRLSRVKLYQRLDNGNSMAYAEGNLKRFEIYGAEKLDPSGNWDSWIKLGTFESIKPSGLPFGQINGDDLKVAIDGEDFSFLPTNPKVRYIRIKVLETWSGGDNFQIMELDIFGDNR